MAVLARSYYSRALADFVRQSEAEILGELCRSNRFALEQTQRDAWTEEIRILKASVLDFDGHLFLEYSIPRMGQRADAVLILESTIVVLEFKVGENRFHSHALDQVLDYALDLKNFHEESHCRTIAPIVVATEAPPVAHAVCAYDDRVLRPLLANRDNLAGALALLGTQRDGHRIDALTWENSPYHPTPTIVEAAQALYRGHKVDEITRNDAGVENLTRTASELTHIIDSAKRDRKKTICFVTGVPGAGKTLAGLNIANCWHDSENREHAIFLSGNGPLVEVLREALVRDEVSRARLAGNRIIKSTAAAKVKAFVQNIHHFRDDCLSSSLPPLERIVIFDEAQRAWDRKQTSAFMRRKRGISGFDQSEPEFLISVMDRHTDWAVIVCLIGSGQEINTGEAGISEWFESLQRSFPTWRLFVSRMLLDDRRADDHIHRYLEGMSDVCLVDGLHLALSVRSFRSELVSAWVEKLLDCDLEKSRALLAQVLPTYPIALTRDIDRPRAWLKAKSRGSERHGLVASSEGLRLRPYAINVKATIDPKDWFLNNKQDVRSSCFLEDVATEFQIQGLELDWACVAWDADLRHTGSNWDYYGFRGTSWQKVRSVERQRFLRNAYRVLLTRSRQGMVIFVPPGDDSDHTRKCAHYDETFRYLKRVGVPVLES